MLLSRDYRRPFWHGFLHAVFVVIYTTFISLIYFSLENLYIGEIGPLLQIVVGFFLSILTIAVCGYLVFYEPIKKILHHHFKAASIMIWSTLGWLFIFLLVFLIGLVKTIS